MGRKIICESCNTIFHEDVLRDATICPVCKASLIDGEFNNKLDKYYYYRFGGGALVNFKYEDEEPIYVFEAVDMADAEDQLKKILPSSPLFNNSKLTICCPKCGSSEFTLLNRGYSIFTGFLGSGKVKRVCNRCKKEF